MKLLTSVILWEGVNNICETSFICENRAQVLVNKSVTTGMVSKQIKIPMTSLMDDPPLPDIKERDPMGGG